MGTTNNALLETYDLGAHRWIRIDSGSIMPIVNVQKLLVRARGVTSGRDMVDEVDKLENPTRSRKRPAELPATSMTRSVKARTEKTVAPVDTYIDLSVTPVPRRIASAPSPALSVSSPTLSARPTPSRLPSAKPSKVRAPSVIELLEDSEADADADVSREAATKKSPWPLKYVVDMARGFDAQKTMAGTVDDTFRAAFGMEPPKSRTTWAKHLKFWKYSTQAERDDFIAAGHSKAGEWRAFMKQITPRLKGLKDEDDLEAIVLKIEDNAATLAVQLLPQAEAPIVLNSEDSICFICTERLPEVQSKKLLSLKQCVLLVSRQNNHWKTYSSAKYIGAIAEYCMRHRAESKLKHCPPEDRWPAYVDFTMLKPRIEACVNQLREIWLDPQHSHFYMATMQQVRSLGLEGAFNGKNDFDSSKVSTVG